MNGLCRIGGVFGFTNPTKLFRLTSITNKSLVTAMGIGIKNSKMYFWKRIKSDRIYRAIDISFKTPHIKDLIDFFRCSGRSLRYYEI